MDLLRDGHVFYAIEGFRSEARCKLLWTYGRTQKNPDWNGEGLGPVVTHAKPFQSAHCFGLALDFCRDKDAELAGLQPDWSEASYDVLGLYAVKRGLLWGGSWRFKDRPHIQLPGYVTALEMAPLEVAWKAAGGSIENRLQSVWKSMPNPTFKPV